MGLRVLEDIAEEFEFDSSTLDYHDAPIAGWLIRRADGALFAFDCQPIIWGAAWHWILVRASEKTVDSHAVIRAQRDRRGPWISIIEDRRVAGDSCCRLIEMNGDAPIPISASRAISAS